MQAEIVGYVINNPKESVTIDDEIFSNNDLRAIFCAVKARYIAQKAITPDLLHRETKTIYGISGIVGLQNTYMNRAEFKERLESLKIAHKISVLDKMFSESFRKFSEAEEPEDKLSHLIALKEKIQKSDTTRQSYEIHRREAFDSWMDQYGKPIHYVAKTGLFGLDRAIGGLRGTELVVIVADTGVGKTMLMLNMCASMLQQGKSVLFFSLEMGVNELIDRLVPIIGGHNATEIRERAVMKEFVTGTITQLKQYNLSIVSSGLITSDDVISEAINQQPDIIMVDYLQLLNDTKSQENDTQRIRQIVLNLKRGALNLGIPIIAPSQVDKASSKSGSLRIENVASSKEIANSADLGVYLYEREVGESKIMLPQETQIQTRLRVVKSRHSAKGLDMEIHFDKSTLRMTDADHETEKLQKLFS